MKQLVVLPKWLVWWVFCFIVLRIALDALLLSLHASQPSPLTSVGRLHNSFLSQVSGCAVVVDGYVVFDGDTGRWVRFEQVAVSLSEGKKTTAENPKAGKEHGNGGPGAVWAKLLYQCS